MENNTNDKETPPTYTWMIQSNFWTNGQIRNQPQKIVFHYGQESNKIANNGHNKNANYGWQYGQEWQNGQQSNQGFGKQGLQWTNLQNGQSSLHHGSYSNNGQQVSNLVTLKRFIFLFPRQCLQHLRGSYSVSHRISLGIQDCWVPAWVPKPAQGT